MTAETLFDASLRHAKVYEIRVPKNLSWVPERAKALIDQLASTTGAQIIYQIVAENDRVVWRVIHRPVTDETARGSVNQEWLQSQVQVIAQAIRSIYPEAEVTVSDYRPPEFTTPFFRLVMPYRLGVGFFAPIKTVQEMKDVDPLASLAQAMASAIKGNDRIIYTVLLSKGAEEEERKWGWDQITAWNPVELATDAWAVSIFKMATGRGKYPKYVPELQKIFETKLNSALGRAYVLVQMDITNWNDVDHLVNLSGILWDQFGTAYNRLDLCIQQDQKLEDVGVKVESAEVERATSTLGVISQWMSDTDKRWRQARAILTSSELAGLWHLPHEGFISSEISWIAGGRAAAPAKLIKNTEGVLIGDNVVAGRVSPIRIPDRDREAHMNILGKAGSGKSTFMHNLIHQDIAAGKGVGVIDPHGKLVNDILRTSIPDNRIDDVVLIDIADEEFPPPLNLLTVPGQVGEIGAGQVLAVLEKIYGSFARVGDTLQAALLTLAGENKPTLRDVPKLFSDMEYRARLANRVTNEAVLDFWQEFDQQSPSAQKDLAYPVSHRMRSFYGNAALYPMMCHPDALDFGGLILQNKIILVSLKGDERKIPPREQRLLGTVLVSQLQMATMSLDRDRKADFYLYIDEVQNFITSSLDEMLPEVRKFGLHLIVANQFLGQLRGRTLEAIMGNVAATIVFQVGPDDARDLAPYFRPEFDAGDLMNLDVHRAAAKIRLQGETLPAFSLDTRPPVKEPEGVNADERIALIRQKSREIYTPKSRQDVMTWLEQKYPRPRFAAKKDKQALTEEDWVVPPDEQT